MASATNLTFQMTPGIGNDRIEITYNIVWSAFDVASKLPYVEQVVVCGGRGRDAEQVVISSTTVTPSGNPGVLVRRSHSKTIALRNSRSKPDDFRAVVSLTPRLPVAFEVQSANQATRSVV